MRPRLLAVCGHDPTGGAGLLADAEVAAASGIACSALITAWTVQTPDEVREVQAVPAALLRRSADALLEDLSFAAVKFGLLPSVAAVEFAAELCDRLPDAVRVADPVLASGAGAEMTEPGVAAALTRLLAPRLHLITPNRSELERLTDTADLHQGAERLLRAGADLVLVTGTDGTETPEIEHWLFGPDGAERFAVPRLPGRFHGSGCTLATAVTAELALGQPAPQAVRTALQRCHDSLLTADHVTETTALPNRAGGWAK